MAVTVASTLVVAVWGLGLVWSGDRAALAVVFALPIALLAVTFGRKGGVAAGIGAMVLIVAWTATGGPDGLGVSGWGSASAVLMLGALLGSAVDGLAASEQRARHVEAVRRDLEETAKRHGEAVAINDTLVQSAAVAKWALEAGDLQRALEVLDETVDAGQRIVTDLLNGDRLAQPTSTTPGRRHG